MENNTQETNRGTGLTVKRLIIIALVFFVILIADSWFFTRNNKSGQVENTNVISVINDRIAELRGELRKEQLDYMNEKFEGMTEIVSTLIKEQELTYTDPFLLANAETSADLSITSENLIRNSSFEVGVGGHPRQWNYILNSSNSNTYQSPEGIRSGKYGLKFVGNGIVSQYGISQPVTKTIPGRTYSFSLYLKTVNVSQGTTVRFGFWDEYNNKYAFMEEVSLDSTKDWYRISTIQTTSGQITDWANWYPIVEVKNHKEGAIYIEDLLLTEGSSVIAYSSSTAGSQDSVSTLIGNGSVLITQTGTMYPAESGIGSLGTSTNKWHDLYLINATINENGDMNLAGDLSVGDDLIVNGDTTLKGDITLGETGDDIITFNGTSSFPGGITVGENGQFVINSSGNVTKLNGVTYSYPSSQGSATTVLINDGSGNLSWGTFGAASVTADSLDFAQFVDAMTVDSNTSVNMYDGTSRDFRFYNSNASSEILFLEGSTARVGIGTTDPSFTLDVNGSFNALSLNISGSQITSSVTELNYIDGASVTTGGVVFGNGSNFTQDAANLFWDNSANRLGIGTTSPTVTLEVIGDILVSNGSDYYVGSIGFNDNGVDRTTSGAFLIGTYDEFTNSASTNVQDVLDDLDASITSFASGAGDIEAVGSMVAGAVFSDTDADDQWLGLGATGARIEFDNQATDEINFLSANVGIGTTAPTAKLHISDASSPGMAIVDTTNTVSTFVQSTDTTGLIGTSSSHGLAILTASQTRMFINASGQVGIGTILQNDLLEVAAGATIGVGYTGSTITAPTNGLLVEGNVGIGNTNPSFKLDVNGDIRAASGSDLYIGSIGLNDTGTSNTTSGASMIGVYYPELTYSSSSNVQDVLDDLDSVIGTIASGTSVSWTDAGTYLYPTAGEFLGNPAAGSNKIAGGYFTDNALLSFGTDNDFRMLFDGTNFILGDTANTFLAIGDSGTTGNFNFNQNQFYIRGDGNVGIGTTAPGSNLDLRGGNAELRIHGSADVPGIQLFDSSAVLKWIIASRGNDADNLYFSASPGDATGTNIANGAIMTLQQSGNVGIGTTNPATFKLQVLGSIGPDTNDTYSLGSDALRWSDVYIGPSTVHIGTSTSDEYTIAYNTTNNMLGFNVNGSGVPEIAFNSSGNVGIGTTNLASAKLAVIGGDVGIGLTSPTQLLHIYNTVSGEGILLDGNTSSGYGLATSGTSRGTLGVANATGSWVTGATAGDIILRAETNDIHISTDGGTSAAATFLSTGDIGIALTSPATRLDIDTGSNTDGLRLRGLAETAEIADIYVGTGGQLVLNTTNSTDTGAWIEVDAKDNEFGLIIRDSSTPSTVFANLYMADSAATNGDYLYIAAGSGVGLGQLALSINASANVGIGTTSPSSKLDVVGTVEATDFSCTDCLEAGNIATSAIATAEILDATILTGDIATDTILATNIATGAIGTLEIADGTVSSTDILDGTILTGDISADTILAGDIAADAIGDSELFNTGTWTLTSTLNITGGDLGLGIAPVVKLDIDTGSNTDGFRLRGLAETIEIADMYVGSGGQLVFATTNSTDTSAFIEVDPKDNEYGLIIRDSSTPSTVFANLYMVDSAAGPDYLNILADSSNALATGLVINDAARIGIGTTPNNSYRLSVLMRSTDNGIYVRGANSQFTGEDTGGQYCDINATNGGMTCASDLSLKKDISTSGYGLDAVNALRGVSYRWKSDSGNDQLKLGFIAQEVEQIIPELVTIGENGKKGINYANFAPILVNAIKEQQDQIDSLKNIQTNLMGTNNITSSNSIEIYPTQSDVEAGDIVTTGSAYISTKSGQTMVKLNKATKAYDKHIIGIASSRDKVGDITQSDIKNEDRPYPIANSGKVTVKVTGENGSIQPGDLLTSSSIAGKAMKATKAGMTVGTALEKWDPTSGKDSILVSVQNMYYDPEIYYLADGNSFGIKEIDDGYMVETTNTQDIVSRVGAFDSAYFGSLEAGSIKAQQIILSGVDLSESLSGMNLQLTGVENKLDSLADIPLWQITTEDKLAEQGSKLASLESKYADIASRMDMLQPEATGEAEIASLTDRVSFLEKMFAGKDSSSSATLAQVPSEDDVLGTSTSVLENLTVTGKTNLFSLGVVGDMSIGQLAIRGKEAVINSLALPLKIQSESLSDVEIMSGKVLIDTKGNLTVKETIKAKKIEVVEEIIEEENSSSIGEGNLKVGETEVIIKTTSVTEKSRIFLTPTTESDLSLAVVEEIPGESFKVKVTKKLDKDISFNWWIVN